MKGRGGAWKLPLRVGLVLAMGAASAFPARASIVFDAVTPFTGSGCDPCTWTHTVTTGASARILVVAANHEPSGGQTIVGVTYNGLALTLVRLDTNPGQTETSLWYLVDPPAGVAHTVSIDFSAAANTVLSASLSLTGVDQANPIDVHDGIVGTLASPAVTLTTTVDGAWIIDSLRSSGGGAPTMVAKPGRTERWSTSSGGARSAGSTLATTTAGAYTMDWSLGASRVLAMSAVALRPVCHCEDLTIVEDAPTATITVTAPGGFKTIFDRDWGGALEEFYDLEEDPGETKDLAGRPTFNFHGLFHSSVSLLGPDLYTTGTNKNGPKLDVIEATGARVRLRQEAFYERIDQSATLPGPKGIGDYSIYPTGKMAVRWNRKTTLPIAQIDHPLEVSARYETPDPRDTLTGYSESGTGFGAAAASDVFVLARWEAPLVRTDFLAIMHRPWALADSLDWASTVAYFSWRDNTSPGVPAGLDEVWDLLYYFKPTNFADHNDPRVLTRRDDYRFPDGLSFTTGTGWNENTADGDFFNESEGAYTVDYHPVLDRLVLDMDGSGTTRYRPFFKVRQWRSVAHPPSVTLEGVSLTDNVDYRADVKPIARAHFGQVLFHTTLESFAAVTTPDIGDGTGAAQNGITYGTARYGSGAIFDAGTDLIDIPILVGGQQNIELDGGRIEFWYKPNYAHNDGVQHYLFDVENDGVDGGSRVRIKKEVSNQLTAEVVDATSTPRGIYIPVANYRWNGGDWIHFAMEWDSTDPTDNINLYMNGVSLVPLAENNTTFTMEAENAAGTIRLGRKVTTCCFNADGIIDEFRIWGAGPTPLAYGGLTADATEFLADSAPAKNFTLGFNAVDNPLTTRRGEYVYFGSDSQFRGLNVLFATYGVGTPDLQWEYWDGTSWANLEAVGGFTDETNDLSQNGTVYWTADPGTWSLYSIDGGPDLFYVRAYLAGGAYTTSPKELRIYTDILLFQYCGDISAAAQTFDFAPFIPTAVDLVSFNAVDAPAAVELSWQTGAELDNLGFHLHRSLIESGPWTRVTPSLIPGLGSSPEGASYTFRDVGVDSGVRYFYRLEDIDTASVSTFHGPVSAVPQAVIGGGEEGGGGGVSGPGAPEPPVSESPPSEGAPPPPTELECPEPEGPCLYGSPGTPTLRVVSRTAHEMTVELQTPGFLATPDPVGTLVSIPGFASPTHTGATDLPLERAVLDGVVGRRARIVSVEALSETIYSGLTPVALGQPAVDSRPDGTVRAVRPRVPLGASPEVVPRARLAGSAFMGQTKKLSLEMHPLRWDPAQDRLVLTQTLRVHLAFVDGAPRESGQGSFGRRHPRRQRSAASVYAFFHTTTRGLHAVPYEAVFSGPRRPLPLTSLRLVEGGRVVPIHVEPPSGVFGPGSVLYFHADREPASTDFSSELSFALERASGGAEMTVSSAAPASGPVSFASYALGRFETNRIYQPGLLEAVDPWLWEYAQSGITRELFLELEGVGASSTLPVRVRLFLQGASDASTVGEHHIRATWNGVSLGETTFERKVPHVFEGTAPASGLVEGTNTLSLTNVGDTGVVSRIFLDRVEVEYPQTTALRAERFGGEWPEDGVVSVVIPSAPAGTSPEAKPSGRGGRGPVITPDSVVAVDVTDPATPVWLVGLQPGPDSVLFETQSGDRVLVSAPEGLLAPRVSLPREITLRDTMTQADYILVTPEAFMDAAQPLLLRRESQGLSTFAASLEDIASEFGGGAPSAEAIREFLVFAFHSWQGPAPRYVLLLGDASYDPRNFTGFDKGAPLPALWTKTSYLLTASDPAIAAVNGEDLLPDLALGRLPATDLAQAEALVQKVLDWEDGGNDLSGAVTLVADQPDAAGDFEADVADIASSFLSQRNPESLLIRTLGASTRSEILADLDGGLSLLSYVGHGGSAVWASENVLNSLDPPSLLAQTRQPMMLTMNCLNGYFVTQGLDSLAEAFLKVEGRGTIAAFSPSGLSLDGPAHVFHRAVVDEIVNGNHQRLGDAVLAAQQTYALTGHMPELLGIYHLFGDPGTRIRQEIDLDLQIE